MLSVSCCGFGNLLRSFGRPGSNVDRDHRRLSAEEYAGEFIHPFSTKGWFSLAHKYNLSIASENTRDISVSISRNIRRTNPLICLMPFSLVHKHKHKRIGINKNARKTNMFVFLVLMLMLMLMRE